MRTVLLVAVCVSTIFTGAGALLVAQELVLPPRAEGPWIAATPAEVERLRLAWHGEGPAHHVVAALVREADAALASPLEFPPRGGQHNQWYQCEPCQMGLATVDVNHHECPRCETVYSGEPYDDVVFGRIHGRNLAGMRAAAWAFAITADRRHGEHAARVLLGYAARYRDYPYHNAGRRDDGWGRKAGGHLFAQTLTEASSLVRTIAPAYDLIHDAGILSEDDHASIRGGLLRPMLESIDRNKAGKSNWQSWHDAALLWGGALLGEQAWVERAIADPENGFRYQMRVSVSEEGMWYENSWGYHLYTLHALVQLAEGARRIGIDLWRDVMLRRMTTLPVRFTMADGSLPRFGDDVQTTLASAAPLVEAAWHATGDPALRVALPPEPRWETVLLGREPDPAAVPQVLASEVFEGSGHALLRTDGEAGLTAALTFGPYGGFHGHLDKLSFVFFGHGRELGVDPGRARSQAYRLPIHGGWYKATVGHNAVLVDGRSQEPARGQLDWFTANPSFAVVAARCDRAYEGVRMRRILLLTPAYLLVLDEIEADRERRLDWLYHGRADAVECLAATRPGRLDLDPGAGHVEDVMYGVTDGAVEARFAAPADTTHLVLDAAPGTAVAIGHGPGASVLDRIPLIVVTRRGSSVRFAAVLEPVRAGAEPDVRAVVLEEEPGSLRVTVRRSGASDVLHLDRSGHLLAVRSGGDVVFGE